MSHKQWIILSITISISFAFAGPSHAADFVFRGPPAGVSPEISHFGNGQSWYGDVSPAGDDPSTSAIFGAQASAVPGDTHIIHFGDFEYLSGGSGPIAAADAVNSTAVVEIGSFVFDFDGFNVVGAQPGSYALTVFPGLTVGAPDTMTAATGLGKLVVRGDGTLTPRYLKVGSDSSTGELVVRGPNTVLQQPVFAGSDPDGVIGLFEVGESSGGSTGNKLTVELGATVDTAYTIRLSESEVLVDGAGSTVNAYSLWVNNSSKFTVSGGAALNSTSSDGPFYGLSNGSEIVFTGAGTTVDTQAQIYVKGGTLEISAGASVHSRKAFSGSGSSGILGGVDASFPGSTAVATVTGAGSSWTQDGAFNAGFSGDGTLNIQDGGLVSNTSGFIARLSGSTGAVTVDGAGSNWANSFP